MGLKLLGSSESRPGFFKEEGDGSKLKRWGNGARVREELMVSVMREVKQALTSSEGMGSRGRGKISWWRVFWRGLLWLWVRRWKASG